MLTNMAQTLMDHRDTLFNAPQSTKSFTKMIYVVTALCFGSTNSIKVVQHLLEMPYCLFRIAKQQCRLTKKQKRWSQLPFKVVLSSFFQRVLSPLATQFGK